MDNSVQERLLDSQIEKVDDNLKERIYDESKKIWRVALPGVLSRVASFGSIVVTQSFIGHISGLDLAAYALVQTLTVRFVNGILVSLLLLSFLTCTMFVISHVLVHVGDWRSNALHCMNANITIWCMYRKSKRSVCDDYVNNVRIYPMCWDIIELCMLCLRVSHIFQGDIRARRSPSFEYSRSHPKKQTYIFHVFGPRKILGLYMTGACWGII